MRKNYLFVGGAMLAIAGCTNLDTKSVEMMAPKGGDFNAALQKEYVALAKMEAAEFDWTDVGLFNSKASAAAAGNNIGPQSINDRRLPKESVAGLSVARSSLVKALEAGGPAKAPQHAARAQAMFDCWMQEQEENFQPDDIARCRAGFAAAMKSLNAAMAPKMAAKPPAPRPAARRPAPRRPAPKPLETVGPFIVFFNFNSAALTNESQAVLANVVSANQVFKPRAIEITGHTDRAGANDYNANLARDRALAVARALGQKKVRATVMDIDSKGESQPMMATPDGAREAKNRRVEILVRVK